MQGSGAKQDIENGSKTTSTPEMKILVVISGIACLVQALALFGWLTLKIKAGPIEVGFLSLDPPMTSIVFFVALFVLPTSLATPVVMLTNWKPKFVLCGSQQLTDSLRGQFAAPFRMKYLYFVQALVNGIALLSLKYAFFWPAALNFLNIVLYAVGLSLVIQHFRNPNVPTDLATTAGSVMGGTATVGRIDSLEQEVKHLRQELQLLKNQLAAMQASSSASFSRVVSRGRLPNCKPTPYACGAHLIAASEQTSLPTQFRP